MIVARWIDKEAVLEITLTLLKAFSQELAVPGYKFWVLNATSQTLFLKQGCQSSRRLRLCNSVSMSNLLICLKSLFSLWDSESFLMACKRDYPGSQGHFDFQQLTNIQHLVSIGNNAEAHIDWNFSAPWRIIILELTSLKLPFDNYDQVLHWCFHDCRRIKWTNFPQTWDYLTP